MKRWKIARRATATVFYDNENRSRDDNIYQFGRGGEKEDLECKEVCNSKRSSKMLLGEFKVICAEP